MVRESISGLAVIISSVCAAQAWCPPGATWTYSISDDAPITWHGFLVMTYSRDTIWGGHPGQVFSSHAVMELDELGSTSVSDVDVSMITWVEGDLVHAPTTWDTLYDFVAVPGDFWYGSTYARLNCPGDPLTVVDSGHVVIEGLSLRYVDVDNGVNGQHRIMERIGYDLWMTPQLNCVPPSAIATLRCYHDDEIDYVAPGWSGPCEGVVGVIEQTIAGPHGVFPNPGSDHVVVSYPIGTATIGLFDATGREVLHAPVLSNRARIDISGIASGLFVYRLLDGAGLLIGSGTWIKE